MVSESGAKVVDHTPHCQEVLDSNPARVFSLSIFSVNMSLKQGQHIFINLKIEGLAGQLRVDNIEKLSIGNVKYS